MRPAIVHTVLLFLLMGRSFAQEMKGSLPHELPIQDNSYHAEEAYNQEPGVVQHIQTFTRLWNTKTCAYSFTQEWPVPIHWRQQRSFSLVDARPVRELDSSFGDLLINYRYQLFGSGVAIVAIS